MKDEASFSRSIRHALESEGAMVQSVESGGTAVGIPDLFIRTEKISAWMELKNLIYPVRSYLEVPFRPGQLAWLKRHSALGGISALAIASLEGIYMFKGAEIAGSYYAPLPASLVLSRVSGRAILEWLEKA